MLYWTYKRMITGMSTTQIFLTSAADRIRLVTGPLYEYSDLPWITVNWYLQCTSSLSEPRIALHSLARTFARNFHLISIFVYIFMKYLKDINIIDPFSASFWSICSSGRHNCSMLRIYSSCLGQLASDMFDQIFGKLTAEHVLSGAVSDSNAKFIFANAALIKPFRM